MSIFADELGKISIFFMKKVLEMQKKREKIKQIYQKMNVRVGEDYIDDIMKNTVCT